MTSGSWRAKGQHWFHSLTWITGHLSLGLLVYLIPNMRHLELFIGLSALPFMALWYLLPESPRWLLSKGRYNEAIEVDLVSKGLNHFGGSQDWAPGTLTGGG